jgi:hypothetical protein
MKPEARIRAEIMAYLKTLEPDVFSFRIEQRAGMQNGCSDILTVIQGRLLALEVKSATGRLTALQRRFLDKITLAGGVSVLVRNADEVKKLLALFPKKK